MKNFLKMATFLAIAIAAISCQKFELVDQMPQADDPSMVLYSIDFRFDANSDEATLVFYDEEGYLVSQKTIAVPPTVDEVVSIEFTSMTEPGFVYTPGLVNGDDSGIIRIPSSSIATKTDTDRSILLVIR